jgi:hypothetical protein
LIEGVVGGGINVGTTMFGGGIVNNCLNSGYEAEGEEEVEVVVAD